MTTTAATGAPGDQLPARRRPAALTFFAIAAIAIGVLRGFSSLSTLAQPWTLELQRNMMTSGQNADNPGMRLQAEVQARMLEIVSRQRTLFTIAGLLAVVGSTALIVGGISGLSRKRRTLPLVLAGFALVLIVDLGTAKPYIDMQRDMMQASTDLMTRVFDTTAQTNSPGVETARKVTTAIASASTAFALGGTIAFIAARVGLCIAGLLFFSRKTTQALFAPAS